MWNDHIFTSTENQKLILLPYNNYTVELYYDMRCAISGPRETPIVWQVSKVEDMNVKGIIRLTFKQDRFDPHTDVIEYNDKGEYVGAWCDYYRDGIPIADEDYNIIPTPTLHSIVTYSGIKPEIKIKGSYKKFTVKFYDDEENENIVDTPNGAWSFTVGDANNTTDIDASSLVQFDDITPSEETKFKQIRVKFIGNDEWISKNLKVWYTSDSGIKSQSTINIVGL